MSTIIRRTNPDPVMGMGGRSFKCCRCHSKFDTFDAGKACAEADFAKADKAIANARRRAARAAKSSTTNHQPREDF
jgi:hypothetical protein